MYSTQRQHSHTREITEYMAGEQQRIVSSQYIRQESRNFVFTVTEPSTSVESVTISGIDARQQRLNGIEYGILL